MPPQGPPRAPAQLDTRRILGVLEVKRAEVEDQLWKLREDPGCLREIMLHWADHQLEHLPDVHGKTYRVSDDAAYWAKVANQLVAVHYADLICWSRLAELARVLDEQLRPVLHTLDHREPLPMEIEEAFLNLISLAKYRLTYNVRQLHLYMSMSGNALGIKIVRNTRQSETGEPIHQVRELITPASVVDDPLVEQLYRLIKVTQDGSCIRTIHNTVDNLQHLLKQSPAQQKRLTSEMSSAFSEVVFTSNVMKQWTGFLPWGARFKHITSASHPVSFAIDLSCVRVTWDLHSAKKIVKIELPVAESLHCPTETPVTTENIDSLRRAEKNVDEFWQSVDNYFLQRDGESLLDVLRRYSNESRKLHRTPKYDSSPCEKEPERDSSLCEKQLQQPKAKLELKVPEVDPHLGNRVLDFTPERIPRFRWKELPVKVKTRGRAEVPQSLATPSIETDAAGDSQPGEDAPPLRLPMLSQQDIGMFSSLFYLQGRRRTQGEIPWIDFRHGMAAMGFAAEKADGSAWLFTPVKFDDSRTCNRKIDVHEPHPSGKIPFNQMRELGRRFNRVYGWTGEFFASES